MSAGWLTGQLPRSMAADPILSGIARIAETIANSYRAELDAIEQHVDVTAASGPMLRYLASWVGADLDPSVSPDRQREVLRAVGPLLGRRGTRRGLQDILEALTGARVRVEDDGGVWFRHEDCPDGSDRVVVDLSDLGELTPRQLRAYIQQEVPVGIVVTLLLGGGPIPEDDDETGG